MIASKSVVVPENGVYEYFVQAVDNAGNVSAVLDHGNYYSAVVSGGGGPDSRTIYISPRAAGSVDGIAFDSFDILAYLPDEDEWTLYFDAEDVGFARNMSAFSLLNGGSILLTPRTRLTVPGLGWVEPQDIIRFTPSAVGPETAGTFTWFFDGSDVGLVRDTEAITSIGFTPQGRLLISTVGNTDVPSASGILTAGPEDLLMFIANTYGEGTSGYFETFLDGSALGLSGNRIWASWVDPDNGDVYFTPQGAITLGGVAIDGNDIAVCSPITTGPITACNYSRYWDGSDYRFGAYQIDSIDLGQELPFQPPSGGITIVKQTTSGTGSFAYTGDLGAFTLTVPGDTTRLFAGIETGAYLVRETAQSGWTVSSVTCDDPDQGTVVQGPGQVLIDLDKGESITCTFTNEPSTGPAGDVIYVSPSGTGTVGGVAYTNGDILRYNGSAWSMYFDGSDVGMNTLKAFTLLPDGSLLLSPVAKTTLSGVGQVMAQDIVRFTPTSTGNNTAGTFQWYFDGSDVGLSTSGEAIDALSINSAGHLVISAKGAATVPGPGGTAVRAADEDLLEFRFTTSGESTAGAWSLLFDGSDVKLAVEDIDALWIDPANGDLYLSVNNGFNLGTVKGNGGDVFVCDPGALGPTTSCTYRSFWSSYAVGLKVNVDGVFVQR